MISRFDLSPSHKNCMRFLYLANQRGFASKRSLAGSKKYWFSRNDSQGFRDV